MSDERLSPDRGLRCGQWQRWFCRVLVDLAGWTGVRQLMVFEMTGDAVTCLLSRNYERVRTGEVLAGRYMDG
tara:strand:- start:1582 stop:1797 length:216 start_codon:yes stop_codon:yes gene_type:complete